MKKFIVNLSSSVVTILELLKTPFIFITRMIILALAAILIYTGISGAGSKFVYQLHGAFDQTMYIIIMVLGVITGIVLVIYSLIKKGDDLFDFAF